MVGEGSDYYYSIIEENILFSFNWSILKNLFFALVLILITFIWFEITGNVVAEHHNNYAERDVDDNATQTDLTIEPTIDPSTNGINGTPIEEYICPVPRPTQEKTGLRSSTIGQINTDICPTSSTPKRSSLRTSERDGGISSAPRPRRSLRFSVPERSPSPPLRRSLRLNTPNKLSGTSSEMLYCKQWCERNRHRNRSKSKRRSSPSNKRKTK